MAAVVLPADVIEVLMCSYVLEAVSSIKLYGGVVVGDHVQKHRADAGVPLRSSERPLQELRTNASTAVLVLHSDCHDVRYVGKRLCVFYQVVLPASSTRQRGYGNTAADLALGSTAFPSAPESPRSGHGPKRPPRARSFDQKKHRRGIARRQHMITSSRDVELQTAAAAMRRTSLLVART